METDLCRQRSVGSTPALQQVSIVLTSRLICDALCRSGLHLVSQQQLGSSATASGGAAHGPTLAVESSSLHYLRTVKPIG
ncbi:hypothetical protein F2P81_016505 [Scophthalmus maximus]|uniref:Uncharacterized protein n=1 Tax=Scophthalmus maximus TaxID=52904 RepID=A0A6A4SJ88_SCOMX|nr:hypothetical protein F2P81_016505 [Scophthalmus maximus]